MLEVASRSSPAKVRTTWWKIYVVISTLLVINTMLYVYVPEFSQKWRIMKPFTLAQENNLAVWWSGISLFGAGLLAYELFSTSHRKLQLAWFALSFLFLGLASDELGSFHERISLASGEIGSLRERIGPWGRLAPFGAIVVALLAYALRQLFLSSETRKSAQFIAAGFLLFGLTVVQEKFEFSIDWPFWLQGVRVGIEEGTELAGIFLLLWGLVGQRIKMHPPQAIGVVIANPTKMRFLPLALLLGAVAHLLVILFLVPQIQDNRGRPAALFPAFIYFTLFTGFFWKYWDSRPLFQKRWLAFAVFSLISSAGSIYNFWWFIPYGQSVVPYELATNAYVIIGIQLFVFAAISRGRMPLAFERAKLPYVIAASVLVGICILLGGDLDAFVYGIFPYFLFLFLL